MDWEIEFYYGKNLDKDFIKKFFHFLVYREVKYNAGTYRGAYFIYGKEPAKDIEYTEKEIDESMEKLAKIIDTYLNFDLKTTSLSIHLDYLGGVNFHFWVSILPVKDNVTLISFGTSEYHIPNENTFLSFVDLCRETFESFNFVFGAYRSENDGSLPLDLQSLFKEIPQIINFYSKPIVDKIGREKLLSAPARKVEELENGGIMLLVCTEQLGCPDELDRVRLHLGYELRYV